MKGLIYERIKSMRYMKGLIYERIKSMRYMKGLNYQVSKRWLLENIDLWKKLNSLFNLA